MPERRDRPITDLREFRDRRSAPASASEIPVEHVDGWIETVCVVPAGAEGEPSVMVAPPNRVLATYDLREYVIALLWSAVHARCADCMASKTWCAVHSPSDALFTQIEEHVDAALNVRAMPS